MTFDSERLSLPNYHGFAVAISALSLPFSASLLHGMMCGYVCAGQNAQGENYLRALGNNNKDELSRQAVLAMFELYFISQQQLSHFDFNFELLLPDDDESLSQRAEAFSEWCDGFIQALNLLDISAQDFHEEESQDAFHHLTEFAQMDYATLDVDEEDERALVEVNEYARMAVLRIHTEIKLDERKTMDPDLAH